jgi:hypothetical protein
MGQLGQNLQNTNVTDPRQARPQDLSGNEMGARLIAQGTRGLAQGFQNYQGQNQMMRQGGGGMGFAPQAQPQVDPSYFQPQRRGPNNLNFYGEGQ